MRAFVLPLLFDFLHRFRARFVPASPSGWHREEETSPEHSISEDGPSHADQLECIAIYARAGYFDAAYGVDAMQLVFESPLR